MSIDFSKFNFGARRLLMSIVLLGYLLQICLYQVLYRFILKISNFL